MSKIVTNGHPIVPGVVAGCHWGHYVNQSIVEAAVGLGWADADAERAANEYANHSFDQDWEFFEECYDIVDEAETWLNENTVGGLWHMADGDFRVDAVEECPECGDLRYSDPDIEDNDCTTHLDWGM